MGNDLFVVWRDKESKYTLYRRHDADGRAIRRKHLKDHAIKVDSYNELLKRVATLLYNVGMKQRGKPRSVLAPDQLFLLDPQGTVYPLGEFIVRYGPDAVVEGHYCRVTVGRRTRSKALRLAKIEAFRRAHNGRLFCEVCRGACHNVFEEDYESCLECHHLVPLNRRPMSGSSTAIEGLIIVCANCHSILERARPRMSVLALQCRVRDALGQMQRSVDGSK